MMPLITVMVNPQPMGKLKVTNPLSTKPFLKTGWAQESWPPFPFYLGLPPTGKDQNYSLWKGLGVTEGTDRYTPIAHPHSPGREERHVDQGWVGKHRPHMQRHE